jgi:hypothetical protein
MKCQKCNTYNSKGNRFCTNCGSELMREINSISCSNCGTENENTSNFCVKCGSNLKHQHNSSSKIRNKRPKRIRHNINTQNNLNLFHELKKYKVVVAAVIALFAFLVFKSVPKTEEYNNAKLPSRNNYNSLAANVNSDSRITEIADKFVCSCGACKDSLEICNCDKAIEERNFIKDKLDKKISEDGIIVALANKYGMLKGKYEAKYKVDQSKVYYGL